MMRYAVANASYNMAIGLKRLGLV